MGNRGFKGGGEQRINGGYTGYKGGTRELMGGTGD